MWPIRRDRVEIWTDILQAVRKAAGGTPPSRIQARANLPHDRFWHHVEELVLRGLIADGPLRTTPEGERFLNESLVVRDVLRAPRPLPPEDGPDVDLSPVVGLLPRDPD